MFKKIFLLALLSNILPFGKAWLGSYAQNPIAQTCFSTDPAPMVSGDRLYVFTGHDEENADFFWMNDWRLFSADGKQHESRQPRQDVKA